MNISFDRGFGRAQGVADLVVVTGPAGAYLVAVERLGGGVRSYGATDLVQRDYRPHDGAHLGTGPAVELGRSGGRLLLAGSDQSRLESHLLQGDGEIEAKASWNLPGVSAGADIGALTSLGGAAGALVYGVADGALWGWRVQENGAATAVTRTGGAAAYALADAPALAVVERGAASVLVVADADLGGLRSYRIAPDTGALAPADQLGADQGVGIAAPTAVAGISAYGHSWAILGAAGTSSLTVMQVGASGDLHLTDHVVDSLGSRFGQVTAVEPFVVGDHAFVLVAGGDGGMELMRLLPTGQLVRAAQLVHVPGQGLQNVTAIETHVTASAVSVFVASEGGVDQKGEGIARYVLDRSVLGQVRTADGARLAGTAGDDLLLGGGGATTLTGGDGDDMLVAAAVGDRLEGGAGADIFVILPDLAGPDGGQVVIDGFEVGRDQLDLSLLAGVRSLSQLETEGRHNGIDLQWQGLQIRVVSADARRLDLLDLAPLGWGHPYHLPPGETLPATPLTGSAGDDSLLGDEGPETVNGGDGNDSIEGAGGDDVLTGDAGRDHLSGGSGADHLDGGSGADVLDGGGGDDVLDGGTGHDVLTGGDGHDDLRGGEGDDTLSGGLGRDSLYGQDGADHLQGDAENDSLWGGAGADRLEGGTGADRLAGNAGSDRIYGGDGADVLLGHRDADTLYGGLGADSIEGHGGADRAWGDDGQDTLRGGFGQDRIWGGNGPDRLFGNQGADDLNGNKGADRLHGGGGPDDLHGHQGPDRAWGGGGRDTIYGGAGQDTLQGGRGPDQIQGQWGRDILHGEQGNDRLDGGGGADVLWGGEGADVFVFSGRHGRDRIMDFTTARDRIDLSALDAAAAQSFADLQISRQEEDLLIHTGVGQITLEGLAGLVLDPADFIF